MFVSSFVFASFVCSSWSFNSFAFLFCFITMQTSSPIAITPAPDHAKTSPGDQFKFEFIISFDSDAGNGLFCTGPNLFCAFEFRNFALPWIFGGNFGNRFGNFFDSIFFGIFPLNPSPEFGLALTGISSRIPRISPGLFCAFPNTAVNRDQRTASLMATGCFRPVSIRGSLAVNGGNSGYTPAIRASSMIWDASFA